MLRDWTVLTRWRSFSLRWWSLSWTLSSFLVFFVFCFLLQRLSFFFFFKLCLSNGFCFLLCLIYQGLVKTPIKDMPEGAGELRTLHWGLIMSYLCQICNSRKKEVHQLRFRDKACEKLPSLWNLRWSLRFLLKILKKCQWVCYNPFHNTSRKKRQLHPWYS